MTSSSSGTSWKDRDFLGWAMLGLLSEVAKYYVEGLDQEAVDSKFPAEGSAHEA